MEPGTAVCTGDHGLNGPRRRLLVYWPKAWGPVKAQSSVGCCNPCIVADAQIGPQTAAAGVLHDLMCAVGRDCL